MKNINVVVTMDCEPTTATSDPLGTGPADFAFGEKAVRGYAKVAAEYGFPVTYFIHPETALGQPEVFKELENGGACLGLHMHPWKFSKWKYEGKRYMAHFGGLTGQEQRSLLSESIALWQHALGRHPMYFRPGTYSANDYTFPILAELGFRGGSVSGPGRVFPSVNVNWAGAEPDPHRAHRCFRQLKGDLDFAEMPNTGDMSAPITRSDKVGKGKKMYPDLRPDFDWGIPHKGIAGRMLEQMSGRNPAVWCFNLGSHNHFDYLNPDDPAGLRLRSVLEAIHSVCDQAGIKVVGATMETLCDLVLSRPVELEEMALT